MKHFPSSLHLLSLAAASLLTTGCITVTDGTPTPTTPFGSDVSLDGLWDVNGAEPTAQSCGDIATVRVVVCWDAAATECFTTQSLTFACANGGFDTRPTRVLAAGAYYSLWEALDSAGNVLQETNPLPLVVTSVGHATLATPDFDGALPPTSVTVQVRFENNPNTNNFLTCSAANIATNQFTYRLHEGSTSTGADPIIAGPTVQSCATGGNDVVFTENASFVFDDQPYAFFVSATENVGGCESTWVATCPFTLTLNTSNVVTCNVEVITGAGC
jgi:hypothetical protein